MASLVIDARSLGDASAYRGIGTYVRHLIEGLAVRPELTVSALVLAGTPLPPGVRGVTMRRRAPGRLASLEHDLRLPGDLRRAGGDVVHSPALDPPRRCRLPWVQTLHDVLPFVAGRPRVLSGLGASPPHPRRLRRAAAIIAVSRHSAEEGIARLGLDPTRVWVVHPGVDPAFRPRPGRSGADPPYVLYVGEYGPHKGYAEAFEVAARLAEAGWPHQLKVAGRIAPWVEPVVMELRAAARRPERVDLLGYVDDLPDLYRSASALVVTSRSEGFGLPALEAMASGTPVVAFANTAIPEVVGDGGILVPDGDVGAMVSAVADLVEREDSRDELSARGLERARAFDWGRCVAAHVEVYQAVLDR